MSNRGYDRGYVDLGTPRPMLRRRRHALARVKKLLVTSAIGATVAGCVAVEIWLLVEDSGFPGLPQQASRPPLPGGLPPELRALMTEAEGIARTASGQPAVSLPPTVQTESQPTESTIEAPLRQTGSEYEKIAGVDNTAAMPEPPRLAIPQLNPISRPELSAMARLEPAPMTTLEPHSIATPKSTPIERVEPPPIARLEPRSTATPESTLIARPEPTPSITAEPSSIATAESTWIARMGPPLESRRNSQTPPHIAKAADRAGFLFADSDVRYLTRAELEKLSANQRHVARNEIFARRGRFFKDDALRAYFSQFPWYRPHAWDVALSPVEQANVALIQSAEQANIGFAQPSEAPVAASRGITGPLPAQTNAESGTPFADPSRRHLTSEELHGLSADQLAVVRNEIFARRGRYFKDDWLRAYFSQFPWYQPYAWDVPLSPTEQANVKLVQSFEQTATTPKQALRMR